MSDDSPTLRTPRGRFVIESMLRTIADELARLGPTARARELRAKAQTYERTVSTWSVREPSAAQLDAMKELVEELHARVIEETTSRP